MFSSVSIRGGRPPRSSRAIADCVVPTRSASSRCESPFASRRSATWSAICAKNQPRSPATIFSCSRSSGRFCAAGFRTVAMPGTIARVLYELDGIPDADTPGADDRPEDAERQPLGSFGAVRAERSQRVERGHARVRILRRHGAAAHLAEWTDDRLADADVAAEPLVLLVRAAAVDPDQHPEAAFVQLVFARPACELGERGAREQRHRAAAAVDAGAGVVRPHEPQPAAGERAQRLAPRAGDEAPAYGTSVEIGVDRFAELDLALDDAPVRELEPQHVGGRIPRRPHGDERAERLPVHQPAFLVDEVEA